MAEPKSPPVRLQSLARSLRVAVLDVLWRQWRAVDAQAAGKGSARAMVDPEALVLMSLLLTDDEPRLRDLAEGWASCNSDLLSVRRTKNLVVHYPARARERLTSFAAIAIEQGKDVRWRSITRVAGHLPNAGVSPRKNKQRAIRVRLAQPAALLLRLRLGFGVGTKADVLGYLLGIGGKSASIREIASATVYTVAAIRRATEDMTAAHLIRSTAGPPIGYRVDPPAWRRLLALKGQPPWRNWHQRFSFAATFLSWTETVTDTVSDYAVGVKGRELLQRQRSAFAHDVLADTSDYPAERTDWSGFLRNAINSFVNSLRADV